MDAEYIPKYFIISQVCVCMCACLFLIGIICMEYHFCLSAMFAKRIPKFVRVSICLLRFFFLFFCILFCWFNAGGMLVATQWATLHFKYWFLTIFYLFLLQLWSLLGGKGSKCIPNKFKLNSKPTDLYAHI